MMSRNTFTPRGNNSGNFTSGLTGSLMDLSRSLLAQGAEEDELELKRQVSDRAERSQLAQDELNAERKRAAEANKELNRFTNTIDPTNYTYTLDDYAPEQREVFNNLKSSLTNERDALSKVFTATGEEGISKALENSLSAFESNLAKTSLSREQQQNRLAERKNRTLAILEEFAGEGYDADQRAARAKDVLDSTYNPQLDRITQSYTKGIGLTKEGQQRAFMRSLPKEAIDYFTEDEIAGKFGSLLGAASRADLLAGSQASAKAANELAQKNIENIHKYNTLVKENKNSGSTSYINPKDVMTALGQVNDLDMGRFDDADAQQAFNYLVVDKNIDPYAAAAAISMNKKENFFTDKSAPSIEDPEFLKLQDFALKMQKDRSTSTTGSSKSKNASRDDYILTPTVAKSLPELLRERVQLAATGIDSRLSARDDYLNTILGRNTKQPNTAAASDIPASIAELPDTTATTAPTAPTTAAVPSVPSAVPESLRSLLANDTLDLSEGIQRTVPAFNPRSKPTVVTEFTPRQEISRELLDTQKAIDGITSGRITSYEGLGPLATKQLLDDIVRKRDRLLRNLRSIGN
jgi:hypothetical protein